MRKWLYISLLCLASCQVHEFDDAVGCPEGGPILFTVTDTDAGSMTATISQTKATAVTALSSVRVTATRGTDGDETLYFDNKVFTKEGNYWYRASCAWPMLDPNLRFYASNVPMTFDADGTYIDVDTDTDAVACYLGSPNINAPNALAMKHVFARIKDVRVVAKAGYTVSNVTVRIVPNVSGRYNLRTEAWSNVVAGSSVTLASALGKTSNDLYLVPGTYFVMASWTASRGSNVQTYTDVSVRLNFEAGKRNDFTFTVGGNFEYGPPKFGGLRLASGPIRYNGTGYEMTDDWTVTSYNIARGKTAGSTFFTAEQMGALFEPGNYRANGIIDNVTDPFDGWRLMTKEEAGMLIDTNPPSRTGSVVNDVSGLWSIVGVSGTGYAGVSAETIKGLLLFPDDMVITGVPLTLHNNKSGSVSILTLANLNEYLAQGCVFLPFTGTCGGTQPFSSISDVGYFHTSSCGSMYNSDLVISLGGSFGINPEVYDSRYSVSWLVHD